MVHQELVETLVQQMLASYDTLSQADAMNQSVALQALFDVRYITALLILRDSKVLCLKLHLLITFLKAILGHEQTIFFFNLYLYTFKTNSNSLALH
jgi:hypothetical protein